MYIHNTIRVYYNYVYETVEVVEGGEGGEKVHVHVHVHVHALRVNAILRRRN